MYAASDARRPCTEDEYRIFLADLRDAAAQRPAAVQIGAVVHVSVPAEETVAAEGLDIDRDAVAGADRGDIRPDPLHDAHHFVPDGDSRDSTLHAAVFDVQVARTDAGERDPHDGIARVQQFGFRLFAEFESSALDVGTGLHGEVRSAVHFGVVGEKFRQSLIRQGMAEQSFDGRQGAGRHVGPGVEALNDVLRMADRRSQHLRSVTVTAVNAYDMGHERHAVLGNVVQTSDERRDIGGSGLRRQQSLPNGEDQRTVGADALPGEIVHSADSVGRAGEFHDDMGMQFGETFTLADHAVEIRRDHLGADVAVHDVTDFDVMTEAGLLAPDVFFGHQRRVGRHAVENAQRMGTPDLLQVGCVDKEFHKRIF